MRKWPAYLALAGILALLGVADYFILTSSATLSRLVKIEISKAFGDELTYGELRASMDGVLVVSDVDFNLPGSPIKIFAADRAEIHFEKGRLGARPETVYIDEPRITISDSLIDEIGRMPPGKPIKERIGPDLPRIVCRGGTIELIFPSVFSWDTPQALTLKDLSFTPVAPYRAYISGRLSNPAFGEWRLAGEVDAGTESYFIRLTSDHIYLGPKIRRTLARPAWPHWDRYGPEGMAAIAIEIARPPGGSLMVRTTLTLKDVTLTYRPFPYTVDHLRGEIDFSPDGFHIKDLHAKNGDFSIRVSGGSEGYDSDAAYEVRLDIHNMPLDAKLRAALDPDGQRIWDDFHPSGKLDATGKVVREFGVDKPVRNPLHLDFKGASFIFREFPYEVKNITGDVFILAPDVEVKRLVASDGPTTFEITGTINDIAKAPEINLRIAAKSLPLDHRLKQAVDPKTRELWDDFLPQGHVDIDWRVTGGRGKTIEHHGDVTLLKCKAVYKEIPLLVSDIEGDVRYAPDLIKLNHLTGRASGAEVELDGSIVPRDEGAKLDLNIDAVGLKLDPAVKKAMPKEIRGFLEAIKLSGTTNFKSNIKSDRRGEKRDVQFELALNLKDGVIDTDVKVSDIQGNVSLSGYIENEKTILMGPLIFNQAVIAEKRVTDVYASVSSDGTTMRFNKIKASAYGGTVSGTFKITPESGEFEGEFAADRLDLREYALDTKSFSSKPPQGKVSVVIESLKGKGGDSKTITGKGKLTITEGNLWTVPVFIRLFSLDMNLAKTKVFSAGTVYFDIGDRKIKISALGFQGEDVSLFGKGTVDFDGNIDLRLKIQSGPLLGIDFFLFKIPSRIFDVFTDAFVGIHVHGTFENPKIN